MQSWAKSTLISLYPFRTKGYIFSFFFVLDLLAILSLFPDIDWIANGIGLSNLNSASSEETYLIQAARVIRTIRLVRLVRVFKNIIEKRKQYKLIRSNRGRYNEYDYDNIQRDIAYQPQSKVGAELSEQTTRRVIIIVIAMLFLVPILSYPAVNNEYSYATHLMHRFNLHGDNSSINALVQQYKTYGIVLYLEVQPAVGIVINKQSEISSLRSTAILKLSHHSVQNNTLHYTSLWFNTSDTLEKDAEFGILLSVFISVMLMLGELC